MPIMLNDALTNWPKIQLPEYQFTDCINIRTASNGARLDVMVGFVREKPGNKNVVLSSTWPGSGGIWKQKTFYIKTAEDWSAVDEAVRKLWPEVDGAGTADEIKLAVQKLSSEKKLLDLISANPDLPRIVFVIRNIEDFSWDKQFQENIEYIIARSNKAGIHFFIFTDRLTAKSVPTSIQSNIPNRLVFRTSDKRDSTLAGVKDAHNLTPINESILKLQSTRETKLTNLIIPEEEIRKILCF